MLPKKSRKTNSDEMSEPLLLEQEIIVKLKTDSEKLAEILALKPCEVERVQSLLMEPYFQKQWEFHCLLKKVKLDRKKLEHLQKIFAHFSQYLEQSLSKKPASLPMLSWTRITAYILEELVACSPPTPRPAGIFNILKAKMNIGTEKAKAEGLNGEEEEEVFADRKYEKKIQFIKTLGPSRMEEVKLIYFFQGGIHKRRSDFILCFDDTLSEMDET